MTGTLNRLASRWTGAKPAADSSDFERTVAGWEAVYHKQFPSGPKLTAAAPAGENSYSLPQLVENVLQSKVMKSASAERGMKLIERAKCVDCHKFGTVGQGRARFDDGQEPVPADRDPGVDCRAFQGHLGSVQGHVGRHGRREGLQRDAGGERRTGARIAAFGRDQGDDSEDGDRRPEGVECLVTPEGLINSLSYQEIADVLVLFESAPRVEGTEAKK